MKQRFRQVLLIILSLFPFINIPIVIRLNHQQGLFNKRSVRYLQVQAIIVSFMTILIYRY